MDLRDLDAETRAKVIELHLRDLHDIASTSNKGKGKTPVNSTSSDLTVALETYRQELVSAVQILADDQLAHSVEQNLENGEQPGRPTAPSQTNSRVLERLKQLSLTSLDASSSSETYRHDSDNESGDDDLPVAESSRWGATRKLTTARSPPSKQQCTSCFTACHVFDLLKTPCKHHYCGECLSRLYATSFTDERAWPPRCCRLPIPIESAQSLLTPDIVKTYKAKLVEFGTPGDKRIYCHVPSCSTFVPTDRVVAGSNVARCPKCKKLTCALCKAADHPSAVDCPSDEAAQATLELARQQGWQRCYSCRTVVDLNYGCNHITCRCGAEFCYVCGKKWRQCTCPQWDQNRLIDRANEIVDRNLNACAANGQDQAPRVQAQQREHLVQQARRNLVENHECEHPGKFRLIEGQQRSYTCEICGGRHRKFILECRRCNLWACNDCQRWNL